MRGIDHVMRTIAPPIVALILLFAAGCGEAGPKTEEIVLPALHVRRRFSCSGSSGSAKKRTSKGRQKCLPHHGEKCRLENDDCRIREL